MGKAGLVSGIAKARSRTSASRIPGSVGWIWLRSIPAVISDVEGEDAFAVPWQLKHLLMAKRARRVVVSGPPMVLHRQPRELVVLGLVLVILRPVDKLDDIVFRPIGDMSQIFDVFGVRELRRQFLEQACEREACPLKRLEVIRLRPSPARILDLFLAYG